MFQGRRRNGVLLGVDMPTTLSASDVPAGFSQIGFVGRRFWTWHIQVMYSRCCKFSVQTSQCCGRWGPVRVVPSKHLDLDPTRSLQQIRSSPLPGRIREPWVDKTQRPRLPKIVHHSWKYRHSDYPLAIHTWASGCSLILCCWSCKQANWTF